MNKQVFSFVCIITLLLSLFGCGMGVETEVTMSPTETESETMPDSTYKDDAELSSANHNVKSYPIPSENVYLCSYANRTCPSQKGGYYMIGGAFLSYKPFGGEAVVLCAQSGCNHADFSCPAYMGGVINNMGEYNGMLYACVKTEEESQIVCHDPVTGEHEVLARRTSCIEKDDTTIKEEELWLARIAYGKLYYSDTVYTEIYPSEENGGIPEERAESTYWEYDMEKGVHKEVPLIGLVYGSAGVVAHEYTYNIDEETGAVTYETSELRLYDPDTWSYTVIAELERDDFEFSPDPAYWYGSMICYKCGNTLCVFDADNGTETRLVTPKSNIVHFWMLDNKVFFITTETKDEKPKYFYYFYDLGDGMTVQISNKGRTDVMVFSVGTEGNEYFVETDGKIISKEDFYNENY